MATGFDIAEMGKRAGPGAGGLARLEAIWQDQCAEAVLPDSDELFLADFGELVPSLLLACRDTETDEFRIEFAGATARALLPLEPVGTIPEHEPLGHPLAWLGAGFVQVRRPAVPRPQWLRHEGCHGLFLPYGGFDGRVMLIVTGIDRQPARNCGEGRVVPLCRSLRTAPD